MANPWDSALFGVDPSRAALVALKANLRTQTSFGWVICHDADVQATEPEEEEQARLPGTHADQGRAEDSQSPAPEGTAAAGSERRLQVGPVGVARPGAGAPGWFRLPPGSRITRSEDIRNLLRRGRRKKTSHLDVFFLSSDRAGARLGLVVPRHGHRVVDRNQVKRRLREIGRTEVLPRLRMEGIVLDLLIRARREAYRADYHQLWNELAAMTEDLCSGWFSCR
jgi:ribonuclease P protein component